MLNDDSLKSKDYIKNSPDVDDSYGNQDGIKDAKDINFDLRNSIKNNLYITIPSNTNGVDYVNYIVADSSEIGKNITPYSNDMTIAEKLTLLMQMKEDIRNKIIEKLKGRKDDEFYDSNHKEKIPFVAYWKLISPLEKPTHLTLVPSTSTISWVKSVTIKATLYDNNNIAINGVLTLNDPAQTYSTTSGSYTFTIPSKKAIGARTYKISYGGSAQKYKPCSNTVSITFVKDTPTIKALTAKSIYQGYYAKYQFLNSQGKAITDTYIQIKIGSGSWTNYKTDSNGIVSIKVTQNTTIYYKFNGDTYYNSVAQKSQAFTIKANEKVTKCSGTMTQSPTSRTKPYQIWSDTYSDCTTSNYLRCGHESTGYSNINTLGSQSGTYHQPATLIKSNWDIGVPKGVTIKSVHVKWADKQTNGPSTSTSKTSFINIKTVTLTVSGATSYTKTINTNSGGSTNGGKWVAHDLSLGTDFDPTKKVTLKLKYGPNESGNVGSIFVKGPQIIVEYIPKE